MCKFCKENKVDSNHYVSLLLELSCVCNFNGTENRISTGWKMWIFLKILMFMSCKENIKYSLPLSISTTSALVRYNSSTIENRISAGWFQYILGAACHLV